MACSAHSRRLASGRERSPLDSDGLPVTLLHGQRKTFDPDGLISLRQLWLGLVCHRSVVRGMLAQYVFGFAACD